MFLYYFYFFIFIYCIIVHEVIRMDIREGLNYDFLLNEMIKECYLHAKSHPFDIHIFITENPSVIEERFFQLTHHLVNIEVMTFHQFLQQLQIQNHLTLHHVLSQTELTYHLRQILNEEEFLCFHNRQPYSLIKEFIPLLKQLDINMTDYNEETLDDPKLKDFIHLYHSLKQRLNSYTHLSLESLFDECSFETNHPYNLYVDAVHLYSHQQQNIFKRLSQYHHITLFYTHRNDGRIFNIPYHHLCQNAVVLDSPSFMSENLFQQNVSKCTTSQEYYTFIASTPHQEVNRAVYTIYQKIVDEGLRYKDFTIVYPHSSYVQLLINTLSACQIPHDLPIVESCQYDRNYQLILKELDTLNIDSFQAIAEYFLNTELENDYRQYFQEIQNYRGHITSQEFKDFFIHTYTKDHRTTIRNQDHLHICTIDQVILSKPQHIFFLGMNETVFPRMIKDTSLLLDEDIHILRNNGVLTPLNTSEQLGVHHNDILRAFTQSALSMTFSYAQQTLSGETLLVSSLYKQLEHMFDFKLLSQQQYLPIDDYYLSGGIDENKSILNQNIMNYINSKNQVPFIDKNMIKQLYSPTLSVSQIETYNKCPFLYFIQYGLGIYPMQEQQLTSNEIGSLVHYVLSINIDKDKDIALLIEQYLQDNDNLLSKIQSSPINQYFIKQLKEDLKITINVLRRQLHISKFQIQAKEKRVKHHIHHMNFKGFVDRIDEYQNYISIIDYKSSQKDIDINLAMQGFNIQMLLYLKMVTEIENKDPGAVLYFNTKKRILSSDQSINEIIHENDFYKQYRFGGYIIDDESHQVISGYDPMLEKRSDILPVQYVKSKDAYKGHVLTPQQLNQLLHIIEEHIYQLYQAMISGNIQIAPKGSEQSGTHTLVNPCRYCPYHSVCGFDVFYNDYEMVQFLDVENLLGGEEDAI